MAVFVKAVDAGSFAGAAAALEMSGPMVGKHVRFLEDRLGVQLLNRTTRRQSLTDFGRAYYDRCRVVLAEAATADALITDQISEPRGRLRVTMPALFGRHCVAPILVDLAREHPLLELELSLADSLSDLGEGGYDLAVRTGRLPDLGGVTTRRVAQQRMIVCAAPAYLSAHGRPAGIEDLPDHAAIVYSRAGRAGPWLFPRDGQGSVEWAPASRLRLDDLSAIADTAELGLGLAWLPSWLVRDQLATGRLVSVFEDRAPFLYDCHLLWLHTPHLPLKVRAAVDALAARLPGMMA